MANAISPSSRTVRARLSNRACDRCRRRKAKCDGPDPSSSASVCTNCRLSGEQCTFDLPLARRGPKAKRHKPNSIDINSSSLHNPPTSLQLSEPNVAEAGRTLCAVPPSGTVSLDAWDSGLSVIDPDLSPQTVRTSISDAASARGVSSLQRWHDLARVLILRDPSVQLERMVNICFQFFYEYLFPLIPLVYEPSLRDGLSYFVTQTTGRPLQENTGGDNVVYRANSLKYPELWPDHMFTLITAVCAEAAFLLPKEIFPEGEGVAEIFLQASRSCLASYLELDLEYPNANSVAIRYLHSNCMHAAGKPRVSWHIFGEATRLAQVMQMHEEKSLQSLSPLEAELRRRAFWIAYIGDKSAAILNNRPITIHKFSFESGITTAYPKGIEDEGVSSSPTSVADGSAAPRSFIAGFNANLRLWQTASDLLLEMRLLESQKELGLIPGQLLTAEERHRLDHLYVLFVTSLDDLPHFLQPDMFAMDVKENTNRLGNPLKQFIIQAANLFVSLHCLKMVIAQKFEEFNYYPPGHTDLVLLRKTEIARDMLRVIRDAPFWSLQVNGEPCVEKIRLIGASLLEIIDQYDASPLSARARNDLSVLLDILTRLDSKASDTLRRSDHGAV